MPTCSVGTAAAAAPAAVDVTAAVAAAAAEVDVAAAVAAGTVRAANPADCDCAASLLASAAAVRLEPAAASGIAGETTDAAAVAVVAAAVAADVAVVGCAAGAGLGADVDQVADWLPADGLMQAAWGGPAPGRRGVMQTVQLQGRESCRRQMAGCCSVQHLQLRQTLMPQRCLQAVCLWSVLVRWGWGPGWE